MSIPDGGKKGEHAYSLCYAHSTLHAFLYQSVWTACLRVCKSSGQALLDAISETFPLDNDQEIGFFHLVAIRQSLTSFKTVLEAEFQTAATYLVTERRGYDIQSLIERAQVIFPEELIRKVPSALFDIQEAGKCIAFALGTAAGFHLMRALETVICSYWNVVMEGTPLPDNRNLGAYIREMEEAHCDDLPTKKVLVSLKQIKDFHRNSLMHPEETLDLDQAIALMGIVQSAVVAMLSAIPEPLGDLTEEMTRPATLARVFE